MFLKLTSEKGNLKIEKDGFSTPEIESCLFLALLAGTVTIKPKRSVFPLVYCLWPNKTFATYEAMLQALKPGLNPDSLMTDFEKGAIRAFQEAFPGLNCTGCFFHLSQSVLRRIQAAGLQQDYQTDPDFASWLRCLPALAFLPPGDIEQAFDDLLSADGFDPRAMEIANYFQTAVETVSPHCSH